MKHGDYKRADDQAPTLRSSLADKLRATLGQIPEFDLTDTDADAKATEEQKP